MAVTEVKYGIACKDLGIDYRDIGPWRGYELTAYGDTIAEMVESASITEVDQDGGELSTYALDDCNNEVYHAAIRAIARECGSTYEEVDSTYRFMDH